MSDAADEVAELGRRAIHTSRVEPLRQRMRTFVEENPQEVDLRSLRRKASIGTPLSEFVDGECDERL